MTTNAINASTSESNPVSGFFANLAGAIARTYHNVTERRRVEADLYRLDDILLRDLGISRMDFPAIMNGTYRRD